MPYPYTVTDTYYISQPIVYSDITSTVVYDFSLEPEDEWDIFVTNIKGTGLVKGAFTIYRIIENRTTYEYKLKVGDVRAANFEEMNQMGYVGLYACKGHAIFKRDEKPPTKHYDVVFETREKQSI